MVCLTFDIEEFDAPVVDYGVPLSLAKQVDISSDGTKHILDLLRGMGVRATFFVTGVFATQRPDLVRRMADEGHEVASHSFAHGEFSQGDYERSRDELERISGARVVGYRSPRMGGSDIAALAAAGYEYDSSLNPCYLPGKYNNRKEPRTKFDAGWGVTQIPASVSPCLRIPLFWLSLHLLPMAIYERMCVQTIKRDGYINLYVHPWEFSEQLQNKELRVPLYIRHNSGEKLLARLARLIAMLKERDEEFLTLKQLVQR